MNKRPLLNTQEASYSSLNTKRTKLSNNAPAVTTVNNSITTNTQNFQQFIHQAPTTNSVGNLNLWLSDVAKHHIPTSPSSLTTSSNEVSDLEPVPLNNNQSVVASTSSITNKNNTFAFCDDIVEVIVSFLGNDFPTMVMNYSLISKQWLNAVIQHSKLDVNNYRYEHLNHILNSTFCNNVQSLECYTNYNTILSDITKFKQLTKLACYNVEIKSSDITQLLLKQLTKLTCYKIDVKIIANMKQLTELSIINNYIVEEDAKLLGQLSNLKTLHLWGGHDIGDKGAEYISKLTNLTSLSIPSSHVHEKGAWHISQLPKLTNLEISYNRIEDKGAEYISQMKDLTALDICYNCITSKGINSIFKMKNLTHLSMCSPIFQIESNIAQLDKLCSLTVDSYQIGPEVLADISKLKYLKHLTVHKSDNEEDLGQVINNDITIYNYNNYSPYKK